MKSLASYFGLMVLFVNIQHLVIRVNSSDVTFIEINQHIESTVMYLDQIYDYLDTNSESCLTYSKELQKSVTEKLVSIYEKLDDLDRKTKTKTSKIMDILIEAVSVISVQLNLHNLLDLTTRIETYYSLMTFCLYEPNTFSNANLENLISKIVAYDSDSVRLLFERLRPLNNRREERGMFHISVRDLKESLPIPLDCIPLQEIFFNIHVTIALSELKAYVMLQTAYILLQLHGHGNFTNESQFMQNRYKLRTNLAFDLAKRSLESAVEREFWRCDPEEYVLNKTFVYFTRFMTGYVASLYDIIYDVDECRLACYRFKHTVLKRCHSDSICGNDQQCTGNIRECSRINSPLDICFANGSRRYTYIKDPDEQYGPGENCQTQIQNYTSFTDSTGFWCEYCMCICESDNYSDIYINNMPVYADITNNYFITGLRFVKVNRIIHLQIQEGKLLSGGKIDLQTVQWRPVHNYTVANGSYHTINYDFRKMDLVDLHVADGELLTGIQFNNVEEHISFHIHSTLFDYKSGLLSHTPDSSRWNYWNPSFFTEILNYHAFIPTETEHASEPLPNDRRFIQFGFSDWNTDASQTTTPYFDTQDTSLIIPVPLTGAGIYFKRYGKYGGFLAPKIFTYNDSAHMHLP